MQLNRQNGSVGTDDDNDDDNPPTATATRDEPKRTLTLEESQMIDKGRQRSECLVLLVVANANA